MKVTVGGQSIDSSRSLLLHSLHFVLNAKYGVSGSGAAGVEQPPFF